MFMKDQYIWKEGRKMKHEWVKSEVKLNCRPNHALANPVGSSGTSMALQSWPASNRNNQAFISPSLLPGCRPPGGGCDPGKERRWGDPCIWGWTQRSWKPMQPTDHTLLQRIMKDLGDMSPCLPRRKWYEKMGFRRITPAATRREPVLQ